ncbi:MAG TPA: prepilin-type N-terminal cleavage/methylation domain-containing protein [Patescibacteria group bacterium]|nr:prepilin-type N-terminal cleavage/methylation domain-containing protein [Patescibacteria group bacterium]
MRYFSSNHHATKTHGFTLIELLITTAILTILVVLITDFVMNTLRMQEYTTQQNEAVTQSRLALKRMVSELREATSADTGAYPLESVSAQEIIFFSDVDKDESVERIRYFLEETNLRRGVIEPTGLPLQYNQENEIVSTFSSYIQNGTEPIFYYFNEQYPQNMEQNPLSNPIDKTVIRMIQIHLQTNVDIHRVPKTRTLNAFAQLRNLKENL